MTITNLHTPEAEVFLEEAASEQDNGQYLSVAAGAGSVALESVKIPEQKLPACEIGEVDRLFLVVRNALLTDPKERQKTTREAIDAEVAYFREHEITPEVASRVLGRFTDPASSIPGREARQHYFATQKGTRLLTKGEEVALAKTMELGQLAQTELGILEPAEGSDERIQLEATSDLGLSARKRFEESNLGHVVSLATKYSHREGIELEELVQEGYLGLNRAVDKFDWQRGQKFSTYANFWIKRDLKRFIAEKGGAFHIPHNKAIEFEGAERLEEEFGEELPEDMRLIRHRLGTVSLDNDSFRNDSGDTSSLHELIPDKHADTEQDGLLSAEVSELYELMRNLPEYQRLALARRYGIGGDQPASFPEIGAELKVGVKKASNIVKEAEEKLTSSSLQSTVKEELAIPQHETQPLLENPDLARALHALNDTQRLAVILRRGLDGNGQRSFSVIAKEISRHENRARTYSKEAIRILTHNAENIIREELGQPPKPLYSNDRTPLTRAQRKEIERQASEQKLKEYLEEYPELDRALLALDETQKLAVTLRRGLDGGGQRTLSEIGKEIAKFQDRESPYSHQAMRVLINDAENVIREEHEMPLRPLNEGNSAPSTRAQKEKAERQSSDQRLKERLAEYPDLIQAMNTLDETQRLAIALRWGLFGNSQRSLTEIGKEIAGLRGDDKPAGKIVIRRIINEAENLIREIHGVPLQPLDRSGQVPPTRAEKAEIENRRARQRLEKAMRENPDADPRQLEKMLEQKRLRHREYTKRYREKKQAERAATPV